MWPCLVEVDFPAVVDFSQEFSELLSVLPRFVFLFLSGRFVSFLRGIVVTTGTWPKFTYGFRSVLSFPKRWSLGVSVCMWKGFHTLSLF